MKYKFYEYTRNDPWIPNDNYKRPVVEIENSLDYGWFFGAEINNLSSNLDYVKEIVSKLEAVLNGKLEFYEGFGFEVYMIECDKENATVKNIFEDHKIDAVIPTNEVYELMRDWRDYLIKYNNERDGEKPILISPKTIKQSDIQEIIDAFQVASGQSYAIKNTEKILLMLEKYNGIEILLVDNSLIKISNAEELSDYILSIDEYVDLKKINDLKKYF